MPRNAVLVCLAALIVNSGCATLTSTGRPQLDVIPGLTTAAVIGPTDADTSIGMYSQPTRAERALHFVVVEPSAEVQRVSVGRRLNKIAILNLINPIGWFIDFRSGAAWRHAPSQLFVPLRLATLPDVIDATVVDDSLMGYTLLRLATLAEDIGCPTFVRRAWEAEADLYLTPSQPLPTVSTALADSIARMLEAVESDMRDACTAPSGMMSILRETDRRVAELAQRAADLDPNTGTLGDPGAPILTADFFFGFDSTYIRDVGRVVELASLLRGVPHLRLVLHGCTDSAGSVEHNQRLGLRRAETIRDALLRAGAPTGVCCDVVSHGENPDWQLRPGQFGSMPGAEYNRRVTFSWVAR